MIDYFTIKRDKGIIVWLFNIGSEKYWNDIGGCEVKDKNESILVNRMEEMILLQNNI